MTTRQLIAHTLSDGKPRSAREIHTEHPDRTWDSINGMVLRMCEGGEIEVVAGFARKPQAGTTARRYQFSTITRAI